MAQSRYLRNLAALEFSLQAIGTIFVKEMNIVSAEVALKAIKFFKTCDIDPKELEIGPRLCTVLDIKSNYQASEYKFFDSDFMTPNRIEPILPRYLHNYSAQKRNDQFQSVMSNSYDQRNTNQGWIESDGGTLVKTKVKPNLNKGNTSKMRIKSSTKDSIGGFVRPSKRVKHNISTTNTEIVASTDNKKKKKKKKKSKRKNQNHDDNDGDLPMSEPQGKTVKNANDEAEFGSSVPPKKAKKQKKNKATKKKKSKKTRKKKIVSTKKTSKKTRKKTKLKKEIDGDNDIIMSTNTGLKSKNSKSKVYLLLRYFKFTQIFAYLLRFFELTLIFGNLISFYV